MRFSTSSFALPILICVLAFVTACASTKREKKDLTAEAVAKYQEALDKSESSVPLGTQLTVSVSGDMPKQFDNPSSDVPSRTFNVPAEAYDAFFTQSPGEVFTWVELEPIQDGGTLLGYRIVKFKGQSFPSVDLRENDIIVKVNGQVPRDPDIYFAEWEKMKNSNKATLDIQRSVDRFTLTWIKQ